MFYTTVELAWTGRVRISVMYVRISGIIFLINMGNLHRNRKNKIKHDLSYKKGPKLEFPKQNYNEFDVVPCFRAELSVMLKNVESACSS